VRKSRWGKKSRLTPSKKSSEEKKKPIKENPEGQRNLEWSNAPKKPLLRDSVTTSNDPHAQSLSITASGGKYDDGRRRRPNASFSTTKKRGAGSPIEKTKRKE